VTASSGLSRSARRERRRRIGYVIYRWVLVLIGSVGVGWLVHGMLRGGLMVPIELPTTGIAIAAACAFAGDLMALVNACGMYVRGEMARPGEMVNGFWKAWGTSTTMFLAVFSYVVPVSGVPMPATLVAAAPATAEVPEPAPKLGDPWLVVYSTQAPPPALRPRLSTIPVFYRNNAAPETAKLARANLVPGVSFAKEELDVSIDGLQRIVAALAACGAVPGGPATELEVAGYASSKEFIDTSGAPQADTDLRNARIANRRARAAFCHLGSLTPVKLANGQDWEGYEDGPECGVQKIPGYKADATPLQVTVRHWEESRSGWQEMMDSRKFVDRPVGVAQSSYNDPEELNRRVDIHVLSAGACSAPATTAGAEPRPPAQAEAAPAAQEQIASLAQPL
jgi:hypothetical protein